MFQHFCQSFFSIKNSPDWAVRTCYSSFSDPFPPAKKPQQWVHKKFSHALPSNA
jgi:hypothetical protein